MLHTSVLYTSRLFQLGFYKTKVVKGLLVFVGLMSIMLAGGAKSPSSIS